MKFLAILFPLLLVGCAVSSDPAYQVNVYGEKTLAYGPKLKRTLQDSCSSSMCRRVLVKEKSIPATSDAIVWVELKDDQSLYMDFGKDGDVVFTYGKKVADSTSHTDFFELLGRKGVVLEFSGYHRWNCSPPKDSCGRKEEEFASPLILKEALEKTSQEKISVD